MSSFPRRRKRQGLALLMALVIGGYMDQTKSASTPEGGRPPAARDTSSLATVRYQVSNIERSIDFYTQRLGFELEQRAGSAFASVTRGALRLVLSGPGSSGARPLPDGRRQEPGGWNRFILYVDDLDSLIRALRSADVRFRNEVEVGPGGKQIQIEDPDGNPIELYQAAART